MIALIRILIVPVIAMAVFAIIRSVIRSMQQSNRDMTMPYCQKCESNRNVVVNAGQTPDETERWYCTHCHEGF